MRNEVGKVPAATLIGVGYNIEFIRLTLLGFPEWIRKATNDFAVWHFNDRRRVEKVYMSYVRSCMYELKELVVCWPIGYGDRLMSVFRKSSFWREYFYFFLFNPSRKYYGLGCIVICLNTARPTVWFSVAILRTVNCYPTLILHVTQY